MNSDQKIFEEIFSRLIGSDAGLRTKSRQEIPAWDSLRHALLVIEIEKKLNRRFSIREIEQMNSFVSIIKLLS